MDILIIQLRKGELTVATFRPRRGMVSFVGAERHELSDADEELSGILAATAAAGTEKRVVLVLPPAQLFMRELELPIADRAKVRELLPLELKGETALETDELVFDAVPLASGKVLAVWARAPKVAQQIEKLKSAGLEPELVTASLFHWSKLAPAAGTAVVTDGEAVAAFRDRTPLYFRALPPGAGDNETARTVAALELSHGVQVDQVVSFARHTPGNQEGAQLGGDLAAAFGDDAHAAHDLAGAYAVAAAVAEGSAVNLRRGELAYSAGKERVYKMLRVSMILAASVVVLAFAEAGIRYTLVKKDLASLDGSIKTIYRQVFPTRKGSADEVGELRAEIRKLEGARTSSNSLLILKDLAEAKGDGVSGIYETEVDGPEVRLKGDAPSFQGPNDFRARAAKYFDGAEVSEVKSRPDGSVTFSFHGTLKGVTR